MIYLVIVLKSRSFLDCLVGNVKKIFIPLVLLNSRVCRVSSSMSVDAPLSSNLCPGTEVVCPNAEKDSIGLRHGFSDETCGSQER